ncbi:uncharacterized protein K452DRAFT_309896 [Aplosporella prunicola CBS 121167]|uniref:Hydrophobin n=1 Tax=Aplosporella prunicola CBS 121167 TaxID=1176127 RepID=A0A6A6BE88_9PEZI|nr:uncharacterized protein K452DRAFT_309896 [Aplosporella prunicola CBS 121167]KAF2140801.1 hypothetical protein K452DRAFT_309896 [Aplosporella prunicola CBS 121167]
MMFSTITGPLMAAFFAASAIAAPNSAGHKAEIIPRQAEIQCNLLQCLGVIGTIPCVVNALNGGDTEGAAECAVGGSGTVRITSSSFLLFLDFLTVRRFVLAYRAFLKRRLSPNTLDSVPKGQD